MDEPDEPFDAPTDCPLSPMRGHGRTEPLESALPAVTGTCPGFVEGDGCTRDDQSLICDFHPAGTADPRPVRLWMSDTARSTDGALVFFWHGLGGNALHAIRAAAGLGPDIVAQIVAEGGIVAAPEKRADREPPGFANLPWLQAQGRGDEDDFLVMDEVVACAREHIGIDVSRIHSTGMSAGGLQTGQVGPRRSGYIASVALFSGGRFGRPEVQDETNKYPVALFHGGAGDMVGIQFDDAAITLRRTYHQEGHFVMICDHGANHTVPAVAATAAWRFLQDHPYGAVPTPYCDGVPEDVFSFCEVGAPPDET